MNSSEDTHFERFLLKWSVVYVLMVATMLGTSTALGVRALAIETPFITCYIIILMIFYTDLYDTDSAAQHIDIAALLGAVILSLALLLHSGFRATIGLVAVAVLLSVRIASEEMRASLDSRMGLFKSLLILLPTVSVYLL